MSGGAAALPDAVVRLVPYLFQMFEHRAFQVPRAVIELQFGHPRLMKRVDQFAGAAVSQSPINP